MKGTDAASACGHGGQNRGGQGTGGVQDHPGLGPRGQLVGKASEHRVGNRQQQEIEALGAELLRHYGPAAEDSRQSHRRGLGAAGRRNQLGPRGHQPGGQAAADTSGPHQGETQLEAAALVGGRIHVGYLSRPLEVASNLSCSKT